jgi:hypothetical protein
MKGWRPTAGLVDKYGNKEQKTVFGADTVEH